MCFCCMLKSDVVNFMYRIDSMKCTVDTLESRVTVEGKKTSRIVIEF